LSIRIKAIKVTKVQIIKPGLILRRPPLGSASTARIPYIKPANILTSL
jgi:hypothetical protein